MQTLLEPNRCLVRSPDKALHTYEGEPAARFNRTAALGAGAPLGRGQAGSYAFAWRARASWRVPAVRHVRDDCRGPNPSIALPVSVRAGVINRATQGAVSDDG
jgi:hypothetical protein